MSRTPFFDQVARTLRVARLCNDNHLSTADGLAQAREAGIKALEARHSRREWLKTLARAGAAGAAASVMSPIEGIFASQRRAPSVDIGIVGAGLAGLACADALAASGVHAAVYDAGDRAGGPCASLRTVFPGQIAERGGEFIDNPHKTMIGYARRFGLAVEDVTKAPGDVFYHFGGLHVPESRCCRRVSRLRSSDAVGPATAVDRGVGARPY